MNAIGEVRAERVAQNRQWGGATHDDGLPLTFWDVLLWKHLRRFSADLVREDTSAARRRAIVVAALCVAFVESLDRREKRP